MRSASSEFKEFLLTGIATFYQRVNITFTDGREVSLNKEDFYLDNQTYSDSAGTSEFPLGEAVGSSITLALVNYDDRFDDYDFYLAKFEVICCCDLPSGRTEMWRFGTFTVVEPEAYGDSILITAINDMYKGDKDYTTNLVYPQTIRDILADSCRTCGVTLQSATFPNDTYVVKECPENLTHRELWGQIAMIAGGNATMDEYNRLIIKGWKFFSRDGWHDGGYFDVHEPKYQSGDTLDGGDFTFTNGDNVDAGTFGDRELLHVFNYNMDLIPSTDDVVITGISTKIEDETYLVGNEGYVINIENELIKDNPQEAVNMIANLIIGGSFRAMDFQYTPYPLANFGDTFIVTDRKGNTYTGLITDMEFTYNGFTTIKCAAQSPLRNSSKYNGAVTQAFIASKKETEGQISSYDKAIQALTTLMMQSFGSFKTEIQLEDESTIIILHNKPKLEDSDTQWKMTADGMAVSTDYGETWNAGIDSKGNAVVNVLSTIGLNFDWASGGTITLGGNNNSGGKLEVYDDNVPKNRILSIDKGGIEVYKPLNWMGNFFRIIGDTSSSIRRNLITAIDPHGIDIYDSYTGERIKANTLNGINITNRSGGQVTITSSSVSSSAPIYAYGGINGNLNGNASSANSAGSATSAGYADNAGKLNNKDESRLSVSYAQTAGGLSSFTITELTLYRAVNRTTGSHFYTSNYSEYMSLSTSEWKREGNVFEESGRKKYCLTK